MDDLTAIKQQLKELKLRHLAANLDELMMNLACSDKSYADILTEVLAYEIRQRRSLSLSQRLKYANFPTFDKPLDLNAYDFGKRQGVSKRQILELSSNFLWIDQAYNVLFLGGSGLGKSFLACYLGYKALEAGYSVIFVSMNNLAHLLKTETILTRSKTRMKRIRCCDLLIVDEIGNAVLERQESRLLFQLVCDFYQQTSMIVTSNKGFDQWSQTMGDPVATTAILDRMLHKCEIFNLEGESWRMQDQQSILDKLLKEGNKRGRKH